MEGKNPMTGRPHLSVSQHPGGQGKKNSAKVNQGAPHPCLRELPEAWTDSTHTESTPWRRWFRCVPSRWRARSAGGTPDGSTCCRGREQVKPPGVESRASAPPVGGGAFDHLSGELPGGSWWLSRPPPVGGASDHLSRESPGGSWWLSWSFNIFHRSPTLFR